MIPKMNGLDIALELRRRSDGYNVPIVFVSGYTSESEILNCLSIPGTEFICKPFHTPELLAKVAVAVSQIEQTIEKEMPEGVLIANRFQVLEKIGDGGYSNVYKVLDNKQKDNQVYALKAFDFPFSMKNRRRNTFMILREIYHLCKMDHPNIVKLYDFGQFEKPYICLT